VHGVCPKVSPGVEMLEINPRVAGQPPSGSHFTAIGLVPAPALDTLGLHRLPFTAPKESTMREFFRPSLLLVVLGLVATSYGVDRLVPSQYPTIQAAIDASSRGDVVLVAPGEYVESVDLGGKSLEVRSSVLGGASIIAPPNARSLLAVSGEPLETRVLGFRLRKSGSVGGGIKASNASLTFESCIIESCVNAAGGAARVYGGAVTFLNCQFVACVATGPADGGYGSAGGIHVSGGTTTIQNCEFFECDGGCAAEAILHDGGGLVMVQGSQIIGSDGATCFGQIYNAQGSLVVEDTVFESGNKPAVFAWSPYTVRRCTFRGMTGGSVLERRGGTYTVDACQFIDCHVAGPLFMSYYSGSFVISNSVFCDTTWVGSMVNGTWTDGGGNTFDCPCPGDVNDSGIVNATDIAIILGAWGTSGGKFPLSDTDGNGIVDAADLAVVLGGWGNCP
jgi:hypothetical protein